MEVFMNPTDNIKLTLDFICDIFHGIHVPCFILQPPYTEIPEFDYGFRNQLYQTFSSNKALLKLLHQCNPNVIYHFQSRFCCHYLFVPLPNDEESIFIIGPFLLEPKTSLDLKRQIENFHIPKDMTALLNNYFNHLTIIQPHTLFYSVVNAMGKYLFGSFQNFNIQYINYFQLDIEEDYEYNPNISNDFNLELLEERYRGENELLDAVSKGNVTAATQAFTKFSAIQMPKRLEDTLRDRKNYGIIFNSILRKAAEAGQVHPLHLDSISSQFAYKIEQASTIIQLDELSYEMIRKYCNAVKHHSLKGHSLLVQKIINMIDSDLKQDLTLKNIASELNVNASYLSTLFKKETGKTLTDYVNSKRMKRAVFLLQSTTLQIQAIASEVGISDLNYFTKVFKKIMGKTPREYRELMS